METFNIFFDDENENEVIQMKQMIAKKLNEQCIHAKTDKSRREGWLPFDQEDLSFGLNYNGGLGKYFCYERKKYDAEFKDVLVSRRICQNCEQTRLNYIAWRFYRKFNEEQVKKVFSH